MDTVESPAQGLIAWHGQMELKDAMWSLNGGRTVEFMIVQLEGAPIELHPFAGFVKRRGNRMGSRFHMTAYAVGANEPCYNDTVMLMAGASPLGQAMTVKFWIDELADQHPFDGFNGKTKDHPGDEFSVVFVELAPDETPVDQTKRNLLENATLPKKHTTSRYAARLCNHPLFHAFLAEHVTVNGNFMPPEFWAAPENAARWMRHKCGVESRSEFDRDMGAASRFHVMVREPYADWVRENGYSDDFDQGS